MAMKKVLSKEVISALMDYMKPDTGIFLGQVRYNPQITEWRQTGAAAEEKGNDQLQVTFGDGRSFRVYESHPDFELLVDYAKSGRMVLFSFEGVKTNEGTSNQATQTGGEVAEKRDYTNFHDVRVIKIGKGDESVAEIDEELEKNTEGVIRRITKESKGRTARRGAGAARDEIEKGFTEGAAQEAGLEGL